MQFSYDNRVFVSESTSPNGEVDANTVFHYRQRGAAVWATYEGGDVQMGTLIAHMDDSGNLEMRYSHLNRAGELMTGRCHTTPELLPDGRLRLHENWQWTSGDGSAGQSVLIEKK